MDTTCPNCGAQMQEILEREPDWAPFVCTECSRSWWPSQLTPEARLAWTVDVGYVLDSNDPLVQQTLDAMEMDALVSTTPLDVGGEVL